MKYIENSMENKHADVRVKRVNPIFSGAFSLPFPIVTRTKGELKPDLLISTLITGRYA